MKIIDATAWCSSNRYGDLEFRATVEDGTKDVFVFAWFSDELAFKAEEIIGLTIDEARDLRQKRDIAYLRS